MNVMLAILQRARTQPDAVALIDGDRTLTCRDLAALSRRTAGHLASLGIRPGDRLGICLKDSSAFVVALIAAGCLGAVVVALDWRARADEQRRLIDVLTPNLVLVEPGATLPTAVAAVPQDTAWDAAVARAPDWTDLPDDWQAPYVVQLTSGTTGPPKASVLSHFQVYLRAGAMLDPLALPHRSRYLCTTPFYFTTGRMSVLAHLMRGDCVVLFGTLFGPGDYVDAVRRHDITLGFVAPSTIRHLLQLDGGGGPLLPSMTALVSVGSPLFAEEKLQALHRVCPNLYDLYGTAAGGLIALMRPDDIRVRPTSVGQPLAWSEVEVVDEDHCPLPIGSIGRLRYRSPTVAADLGTVPMDQSFTEGFRNGWYYPGEFASLDELSFIYIEGRAAEVIMRGGAKVHPAEIEAVLLDHPAVIEAAVLGYRGSGNDEEILAFVVIRNPVPLGTLVAHCRMRLTAYKLPRDIRIVDRLPKNTNGKVDKKRLAAEQGP